MILKVGSGASGNGDERQHQVSTPGRESTGVKRRLDAARNSVGLSGKTDRLSSKKQSIHDGYGIASDIKNSTGGLM